MPQLFTAIPQAHPRAAQLVPSGTQAAGAPHWRRRTGHNIVEYAFRDEGKDTAVRHLRDLTGADTVLFAGDDLTDEDALRSLPAGDVGVHVGAGQATAATVVVPDIPAFAAFLDELVTLRAAAAQ